MAYERPLRPDEDEYRTEVQTSEVADESASVPGAGTRPWLLVGLVLLALFLAICVYALVLPVVT